MTKLWLALKKVPIAVVRAALIVVVAISALAMFFGPPLALVAESIDLARMRDTAPGKVDNVAVERGSKGTSRARITYSFTALGQQFQSERYMPGFFGNHATWTGGGRVANDFPVGKQITVHYDPDDPGCSAIEYGWFRLSVGLTGIFWGMVVFGVGQKVRVARRWGGFVSVAGLATAVYGFALLFFGPQVVRVADLHWHALAWGAALVVVAVLHHTQRRSKPHTGNDCDGGDGGGGGCDGG